MRCKINAVRNKAYLSLHHHNSVHPHPIDDSVDINGRSVLLLKLMLCLVNLA